MKKRLFAIIAACVLIICLAYPAAAETYTSENEMSVTFDGTEMKEVGFSGEKDKSTIDDFISEYMQPGDTAVFKIKLKNDYNADTDWWMENRIIYSLEDRSNDENTKGGGYSYELTYTDNEGVDHPLFTNANTGGDETEYGIGLWEVTYGLQLSDDENFFFLDTFGKGEGGVITLSVTLDGETQGNDYQDTLADLGMNWAVEMTSAEEETTRRQETTTNPQQTTTRPQITTQPRTTTPRSVKTGDESNAFTYFVILAAAGVIILVFAIIMIRRRRKENDS